MPEPAPSHEPAADASSEVEVPRGLVLFAPTASPASGPALSGARSVRGLRRHLADLSAGGERASVRAGVTRRLAIARVRRARNVEVLYFVLGASIFSSFAFLCGPGWAYSRGAAGRGALAGLVAGSVVSVLFLMSPEGRPWPLHEGVYGLVANVLVFVGVSLRTPPEPMATLRPYLESATPEPVSPSSHA